MMQDVKSILQRLENGDGSASEELLPALYQELRGLAAHLLNGERVNHTLTPTALVHEAYLRLVATPASNDAYQSHAHFFSAAAQAMRRILIDSARRKKAVKRGGGQNALSLDENLIGSENASPDIEALDEALTKLQHQHPDLCELVCLRYFAGMTMPQAAEVLGLPLRTVERNWHFARAWLRTELSE